MQETGINIRLFSRSYGVRSRLEHLLLVLALLLIALHGWLLYQLIAVRDFHSAMIFLYLFSLLPFSLFLVSVWFDRNPSYQRHLTLQPTGVRYRLGFMQREHDFDWEEVETISMAQRRVLFELKNGERHEIDLESVRKEEILQQVREGLEQVAAQKGIELYMTR